MAGRVEKSTGTICQVCGMQISSEGLCACTAKTVDPMMGRRIDGRYEILDILGRGGMSVVYKARHVLMDRLVAVKMLTSHHATTGTFCKRFEREAKLVSKLSHPNIVVVFDFGFTEEGLPYLVMDYLKGRSLADVLAQHKRLNVERTVSIFSQVCDGLAHAHHEGVIHRDVKPSNLMLLDTEYQTDLVKVLDFGIAKLVLTAQDGMETLTHTAEIIGSPLYMSPEQCRGQKLDERSDIYSLGAVIYQMLTGKAPLLGDTFMETLMKHSEEIPAPFAEASPDIYIPELLEAVVFCCLNKDPNKRPKSMIALKEMLQDALPRANIAQYRSTPQIDWKALSVIAVTTLLLAGTITYFFFFQHNKVRLGINSHQSQTKDDDTTIGALNQRLADVYFETGKFDRAIPLYLNLLKLNDKSQAASASNTLHILNHLASCFDMSLKYDQSEIYWQRALKIAEGSHTADEKVVAQTWRGIADHYIWSGQSAKAEIYYQRLFSYFATKQQFTSPEAIYAKLFLAESCKNQGKYKKAQTLYAELKHHFQKPNLSKDEQLDLARVTVGMGVCYSNTGDTAKAEGLLKEGLAKRRQLAAPEYELAETMTVLADTYWTKKNYAEAEKSYRNAIALYSRANADQKTLAWPSSGLASTLKMLGRYEEAEVLYKQLLAARDSAGQPQDDDVIYLLQDYASVLQQLNRNAEAEQLLSRLRAIEAKGK